MIDLRIDARELDVVVLDLGGTEKEVQRALRSTLNKMSAWLRTRASRVMSRELGLAYGMVRRRVKNIKFKANPAGGAGGVWIGLNPIDLKYLQPEQDGMGVSAGPSGRSQSYEGAFMGPRPGVTAAKLKGRAFKRKGKGRLPIERVDLAIKDQADTALEVGVVEYVAFESQFYKTFEHELKWRIRKRK